MTASSRMIDTPAADPSVVRVVPTRRRVRLRDVANHVQVIRIMAVRDLKAKYKQSVLGAAWVVIQPAGLLIGLTVAFSHHVTAAGSATIPYALFAMTGLCVWSYFQAAMVMGTASLVSNYFLIKRTPCPRITFPVSALIASTPTIGIVLVTTLVTGLATGSLSVRALLIPLAILWLLLLTAAIVAACASTAVYFRDVVNALPLVLQVGVFVAPVGYALGSMSGITHLIVELNPLTGVIEMWRWMLLAGYSFEPTPIVIAVVETVVLATVGWWLFARLEPTAADRI